MISRGAPGPAASRARPNPRSIGRRRRREHRPPPAAGSVMIHATKMFERESPLHRREPLRRADAHHRGRDDVRRGNREAEVGGRRAARADAAVSAAKPCAGVELHEPHAERADDAVTARVGAEADRRWPTRTSPRAARRAWGSCRPAKSASVITPIVFCASFEPWLNAITDAETSCASRKRRISAARVARSGRSRDARPSGAMPIAKPTSGATSVGISTLWRMPRPQHRFDARGREHRAGDAADQAVRRTRRQRPPPGEQVPRDRADESAEDHRLRHDAGSTMPFASVAATWSRSSAPTTLSTAAATSATLGGTARVEIEVATAFAASWKPLVKSKSSAVTIDDDEQRVHQSFSSATPSITLATSSQRSVAPSMFSKISFHLISVFGSCSCWKSARSRGAASDRSPSRTLHRATQSRACSEPGRFASASTAAFVGARAIDEMRGHFQCFRAQLATS